MTTVIQTRDLVKTYGRVRALDGLDLSVSAGEVHGFLGPNGAGKTTAIAAISDYPPISTDALATDDLQDVKELVSLLRRCSNNLNQYAKRANETGNIYESDIRDLQERLEEIWTDMKEVLVCLSSIQ